MAFLGPTRVLLTSICSSIPNAPHACSLASNPSPSLLSTANKAGPYIYAGRASNTPTSHLPVNEWWRFLIAAQARHLTYWKELAHLGSSVGKLEYESLYDSTMLAIDHALGNKQPTDIEEQSRLIEMERDLTHETFARFPILWQMCFNTKYELFQEAHESLRLLHRVTDPGTHLLQFWKRIKKEWIVLDEPVDILSGDDPAYMSWEVLEHRKLRVLKEIQSFAELFAGVVM